MAFDMRMVGIRRDPRAGAGHVDAVHADLRTIAAGSLARSRREPRGWSMPVLRRMQPSTCLSTRRGRVLDEPALVDQFAQRREVDKLSWARQHTCGWGLAKGTRRDWPTGGMPSPR